MKESLKATRITKNDFGFFASTHDPAIHHTHSNAQGRVATYYAHPIITAKIKLPENISWLSGRKNGAVK